jgi:hypothetical protein
MKEERSKIETENTEGNTQSRKKRCRKDFLEERVTNIEQGTTGYFRTFAIVKA